MSGTPQDLPERVHLLLGAGRLRNQDFKGGEVAALWSKAVGSAKDASLPAISLDGALRAAYDATLNGCFAVLAAYQLRTGSGHGHHEVAFSAVEALGLPALRDLVPDSEGIRSLRRSSVYDPVIAEEHDRATALDWMRTILPPMRTALLTRFPELAQELPEPPAE